MPRRCGKTLPTTVRLLAQGAVPPHSVSPLDFSGKLRQVAIANDAAQRTILVGIGENPSLVHVREGLHTAMQTLRSTHTPSAHVIVPKSVASTAEPTTNFFGPKAFPTDSTQLQRQVVQWARMSLYEDSRMKSKSKEKLIVPQITFGHSQDGQFDASNVRHGQAVAESVNHARDLGNCRPDVMSPDRFATEAKRLCSITANKKHKVTVRHDLRMKDLKSRGLNLLAAVGQGAVRPPRLVVLEYNGNPKSKSTTAVVGKGVTMDTGGLNVKPFGSMETMHMDMMGAAAVFGMTEAIARLQLPVNFVSVFALAENAVGPNAVMPSCIVRSLKGSTVEITNTDAEGRLVLADAMTFVQDYAKLKTRVDYVIDVATLTGACTVALGNERAGLFSNNYGMVDTLVLAGEETTEPVWPLPITAEHESKMQGLMSDLINCTSDRYAGACTAAAFLKHFVNKDVQWAHLDIAGPGIGTKATNRNPAGAPGFGVQLLVRYFEKLAQR
uniref:Cytosol aminopeptidase domain-containing protein n=1 Tax=Neobodo designis TaxID=312471 RepID=A0A7S1LCH7_NEODS|eukprot:CAMPEP_0174830998 /NCGR_PEP_ID=MMETSP1114-20130205/2843_1 /TAXON_ID=312471 /ORGANISM="Neobodo designis, Strain CCAP 1951/1" /LENGTH=497 /DNA_ID=CAMNT_0016064813 /DNA_START=24 /DNA_END=1517 /DNA_ORIENTATION=+